MISLGLSGPGGCQGWRKKSVKKSKRKGGREEERKGSICVAEVLQGLSLISPLSKTASDVDIIYNYRHRFKGKPIGLVFGALSRHK